jgi:hypothetical protein
MMLRIKFVTWPSPVGAGALTVTFSLAEDMGLALNDEENRFYRSGAIEPP